MDAARISKRPVHGGLNYAELEALGIQSGEVLDFSASINPLGPSQRVREAISGVDLAAYPDPECGMLREALSDTLGVESRRILPGNGSTELIHLLARSYLSGQHKVVIFAPTFGEYHAACSIEGQTPMALTPSNEDAASGNFRWDIEDAAARIARVSPSLVFLCNPNNPTGVYMQQEEVKSIADAVGSTGILVIDEAYLPFVEESWDSVPMISSGNVVVLRSMTKDFALTGLRLGYLLAPEDIIAKVKSFQYSWSVNSLAQAAGIAALGDSGHVARGRQVVKAGREFLAEVAERLGLSCTLGTANFMLLNVGCAKDVRRSLLIDHHICVRDCTSFGLPEHIRIGIRNQGENRRLAGALEQVMGEGD